MSLNKDDPTIKSFIDAAQQDLKTVLDDTETEILQAGAASTSAGEFAGKVSAIASATPNDFKNLSDKINYRINTAIENNPNYVPALTFLSELIDTNNGKTIKALEAVVIDYAAAVIALKDDNGAQVFPDNIKPYLDELIGPFYANLAVFFGWLELQPTPSFVTG
ncbi:hypothetical protein [Burkholderia sp. B21-007]|uniref:hypothetical protein n=1 Tax=Burkholderia sp. B21-007 TaxID=2890407 RepID=UPI001E655705|nr:hypothetical protein [Burkholderia sp. B21-007]UEP28264.1 hypothetical protein LMA01_02205 [Burkholderia sp. B21-007]